VALKGALQLGHLQQAQTTRIIIYILFGALQLGRLQQAQTTRNSKQELLASHSRCRACLSSQNEMTKATTCLLWQQTSNIDGKK